MFLTLLTFTTLTFRTPHPTVHPTETPRPSVSCSVKPKETEKPIATDSATPNPTPSNTVLQSPEPQESTNPTPSISSTPRTDLSDGRSDGHTESLACLRPSDNCNPQVLSVTKELPSTGGGNGLFYYVGISLIGCIGVWFGLKLRNYGRE